MDYPTRKPKRAKLPYCGLPPEIWLHILSYAILGEHPLVFRFSTPKKDLQTLVRQPGILRTCTLFRREALQSWYTNNVFMVIGDQALPPALEGRTGAMPPNMQAWICAIGAENREAIQGFIFTHFRRIPARKGFIDGSVVRYRLVQPPTFELFGRLVGKVEEIERELIFRPFTYVVGFESFDLEGVLAGRGG